MGHRRPDEAMKPPARSTPTAGELVIGADPARWRAVGFHVRDGEARVGDVVLFLDPRAGSGIVRWGVHGLASEDLDGLPTRALAPAPSRSDRAVARHPNGALCVDHVVALSPSFERTVRALERAGLDLRREREVGGDHPLRQGFFVVGGLLLELVEKRDGEPTAPAAFWGVTFVVEDLDACSALLGDLLGEPRDAVQPGRRIATVRRSAGLGVPVALMTPRLRP
jgi:hypothetical protein